MDVSDFVDRLRALADCVVHPPTGLPAVRDGLVLPDDLAEFYGLCGGVVLFADADLPLRVSGPGELVPAAPRLLTEEIAAQALREAPDSVVSTCFVIVDNGEGGATEEHVVIDLHPSRLGRCYETFWDRFGLAGDMPVVARTFAELLDWLLATEGEGPERALETRPTYGDAYDDPGERA